MAEIVDLASGRRLVFGVDGEPDALADAHVADAVEAEMRQGPFNGGALRIGDAGPQLHLDHNGKAHYAPGQSSNERPVMRS